MGIQFFITAMFSRIFTRGLSLAYAGFSIVFAASNFNRVFGFVFAVGNLWLQPFAFATSKIPTQ